MAFVLRHPASMMVLLIALGATATVFVVRPQYRPRYESKTIDFSKQQYYNPDRVLQAFATEGIRLTRRTAPPGLTILSTSRALRADDLQVTVGPRQGQGSWGPKLERYDERFGNVLVTYGGRDEQLLRRVKAAVSALRNA